jgi:hypothetical protein
MPIYVTKNLTQYNRPPPLKPQHCPYKLNPISYGKDNQAQTPTDDSPLLNVAAIECIQQIIGTFLYYRKAVDPTIQMALSAIPSLQSKLTTETKEQVNQFLDYMWTHPDANMRYTALT